MIASQDYGWSQWAAREGRAWPTATGQAMEQAHAAGIRAWEPLLRSVDDARRIGTLALQHGLQMPSVFLTGPLHEVEAAAATVTTLAEIVRASLAFGCASALIYPAPLQGAAQDKTDPQLATQARALEALAWALAPLDVRLIYHPEEGEMRQAAREFHHMLLATDPTLLGLCLDPDTVWRGAGFSQIALFDIIRLHGHRVDSVHLRQSQAGVWAEVLGPGDLDYPALIAALAARGAAPRLVIEQALEPATPATLTAFEAHRQSADYVARALLPLLHA